MKIGIVGDVHGNYEALTAVLDDMNENNVNSLIVLGDIIFSGNDPQKCFDKIKQLEPLVWIKGNTDDWFNEIDEDFQPKNELEYKIYREFKRVDVKVSSEVRNFFSVLREKEEIKIAGKRILCVHGSDLKINEQVGIVSQGKHIYNIIDRLEQDILLCAHTHLPYIVSLNNKLIMNVGSVGLPKDEVRSSYGILNFDGDNFEYSIRKVQVLPSTLEQIGILLKDNHY